MGKTIPHVRDAAILSAIRVHRIVSFTELRERFFESGDRSSAYKRIHLILGRYPNVVEEWRMSGSRELFVRAKPTPGVAGSYDQHDQAVSRIVLALRGLYGPDLWLREAELRSGNLGVAFAVLSRSLERRAPDAAWSFGDTARQLAAIEYERTLKSAKRIRGIVAHYEDRIECAFRHAFIVTDDSLIAKAYEFAIQTFYARVRFHIRPKSKVILLDDGWDLGPEISSHNMSRLREIVRQEVASAQVAEKGSHSHEQVA